jgi:hypothetical protein
MEMCRCTILRCVDKEHLIKTAEQWSQWQADYLKEMEEPAPLESLREGALTGTLDQSGSDWLSRRVGAPQGILWHTDGSISVGDASLSFAPSSLLTTVDYTQPANNEKIIETLRQMQHSSGGAPEHIVMAGTDDDYVWPPGIDHSKIRTLTYRCDFCRAWVKTTPLNWSAHNRILVCLCHAIVFRQDVEQPSNYKQWRDLIVTAKAERYKHSAGTHN